MGSKVGTLHVVFFSEEFEDFVTDYMRVWESLLRQSRLLKIKDDPFGFQVRRMLNPVA